MSPLSIPRIVETSVHQGVHFGILFWFCLNLDIALLSSRTGLGGFLCYLVSAGCLPGFQQPPGLRVLFYKLCSKLFQFFHFFLCGQCQCFGDPPGVRFYSGVLVNRFLGVPAFGADLMF